MFEITCVAAVNESEAITANPKFAEVENVVQIAPDVAVEDDTSTWPFVPGLIPILADPSNERICPFEEVGLRLISCCVGIMYFSLHTNQTMSQQKNLNIHCEEGLLFL